MKQRAWALLPLVAALYAACDSRACLAQSDLFANYRPELIEECCQCLARRGTAKPGASCGIAQLTLDGGVVIADGSALPEDAAFTVDDNDDVIDDFELACLCGVDATSCAQALSAGDSLVVVGACVRQGSDPTTPAPCELECRDVLTFDPPTVAP